MIQYFKKPNLGKVERLEEETLKKHPEKLENLLAKGYIQVMGEDNYAEYKKPSIAKKVVKKVAKKVTKKMKK
tara:strand:+ start:1305 stop:1520 length:216 start_codon:yes stop_codon:yes gene_type:complete